MKKLFMLSIIMVLSMFVTTSFANAACPFHKAGLQDAVEAITGGEDDEIINDVCPVMGGKVSNDTPYKVAYKGKNIGLCCEGCIDAFKDDPTKYENKLDLTDKE